MNTQLLSPLATNSLPLEATAVRFDPALELLLVMRLVTQLLLVNHGCIGVKLPTT